MKALLPENEILEWVFAPITAEVFANEYWGQKPLRISRGDPSYFKSLLQDNDLDYILHTAIRRRGNVEILNGGGGRPPFNGGVELAVRSVREGSSLRINSVQRFSPPLQKIRSVLEQRFSCAVNMNMYLTPGDGKALGKHVDTHDVLVLQINGQKRWQLSDGGCIDPIEFIPQLRGETRGFQKRNRIPATSRSREESDITDDFKLEAGDLLYLPRGHQHAAQGELGTVSCHITIGFQVYTYLDLFSAAVASTADRIPSLRKALPAGFSWRTDVVPLATPEFQSILSELNSELTVEPALQDLGRLFTKTRENLTSNQLLRFRGMAGRADIGLETVLKRRSGIVFGLERNRDEIALTWRDHSLTLPAKLEEACLHLMHCSRFRPTDLPGEISDEEKIAFAMDMEEGHLVFISGRSKPAARAFSKEEVVGWLPAKYDSDRNVLAWQFFGDRPIVEPFFRQSLQGARDAFPERARLRTNLTQLDLKSLPKEPAGFIFHISRCGSTTLSNALRPIEGVQVISEPSAVNQAVMAIREARADEDSEALITAEHALRKIIGIFCNQNDQPSSTIFKFTSWNILELREFQRLWPTVPCVVVTRSPVHVMVSCLAKPSGWMASKENPEWSQRMDLAPDLADCPSEEYCAKMLGRFMATALESASSVGFVDYSRLDMNAIEKVAEMFGLKVSEDERQSINASLAVYSKDSTGTKEFIPDDAQKEAAVTEAVLRAAEIWALPVYESVLAQQI